MKLLNDQKFTFTRLAAVLLISLTRSCIFSRREVMSGLSNPGRVRRQV
jgi:hypothetical protein